MTAPTQPPPPPPGPPGPPPPQQANKHDVLLNLLEGGRNVLVHFNPRVPSTCVPRQYQRDKAMALDIGYSMAKPIPDLVIEHDGFGATLSFGGQQQWVFIPFEAVFAMACDIVRIVWPQDVPPDLNLGGRPAPAGATPRPGASVGGRVTPLLPPRPEDGVTPANGAVVIDLMARRTPKDRRACEKRLGLIRPPAGPVNGGSAA